MDDHTGHLVGIICVKSWIRDLSSELHWNGSRLSSIQLDRSGTVAASKVAVRFHLCYSVQVIKIARRREPFNTVVIGLIKCGKLYVVETCCALDLCSGLSIRSNGLSSNAGTGAAKPKYPNGVDNSMAKASGENLVSLCCRIPQSMLDDWCYRCTGCQITTCCYQYSRSEDASSFSKDSM